MDVRFKTSTGELQKTWMVAARLHWLAQRRIYRSSRSTDRHNSMLTKLCECGCGLPAPIAKKTVTRLGHVKGEPMRFIIGHGTRKGPNRATHLPDGTSIIHIENRKGQQFECYIDSADYALVETYHWHVVGGGKRGLYVATTIPVRGGKRKQKLLLMHNLLLPEIKQIDQKHRKGKRIDHVDRNGLNNRRNNLREATATQSSQNRQYTEANQRLQSSPFRGVRNTGGKLRPFEARIYANRKRIILGHFKSEVDAARAYNDAALKHFGQFAPMNDIKPLFNPEMTALIVEQLNEKVKE